MECEKNQRKVLCELNTKEQNGNRSQGHLKFSGFSDSKASLRYLDDLKQYALTDDKREKREREFEKENCIDLSCVKKEPRVTIHKIQKKKEDPNPVTFEYKNEETSKAKRKKTLDNLENSVSFEVDKEALNESLETKIPWDENSVESGELPPSLTDLIFKPKPNKICRPPNAFMLFAKEHRRQVGIDHPEETNRQISTLLGNMWRDLSDEDKMKYYKEAQALEKLHKEKYPSYVYSPNEARMRKQSRVERKLKVKETPLSSKQALNSEERNADCSGENINGNFNETGNQQPFQEKYLNSPLNPFYTPFYYSYPFRGWPMIGCRMPTNRMIPNMGSSQCNCQYHGFNKRSSSNQSGTTCRGESNCPPMSSLNNPRTILPFSNQLHPFPPRPMFPDNFPPAIWNPWFIWPAPRFCPPTTVNSEEVYKNCMRSRLSHQQQRSNLPGEKKNTIPQQSQSQDSEDDDGFQPLIIDDSGANSDDDKENSK
ncbi:HMG box domain-containing protein [Caerostris darwini]|uniref:HMG box domain-containing protein n=1 Tax=Caerostris darwini TaxID=1538125 RepID=A0AAV4U394_9ARAC|nr:HMG box domain-containing protein [Caerostris darwini]